MIPLPGWIQFLKSPGRPFFDAIIHIPQTLHYYYIHILYYLCVYSEYTSQNYVFFFNIKYVNSVCFLFKIFFVFTLNVRKYNYGHSITGYILLLLILNRPALCTYFLFFHVIMMICPLVNGKLRWPIQLWACSAAGCNENMK